FLTARGHCQLHMIQLCHFHTALLRRILYQIDRDHVQRNSSSMAPTRANMTFERTGCTRRADGGASLRVLIDSSTYRSRNIGDTAMLQVALARLREFWPQAAIQ